MTDDEPLSDRLDDMRESCRRFVGAGTEALRSGPRSPRLIAQVAYAADDLEHLDALADELARGGDATPNCEDRR